MWYVLDVPSGFTVWPPEPAWTSLGVSGIAGVARKPRLRRSAPDHGAAQRRVRRPGTGVRLRWPDGSQGPRTLPFQRPEGATDQQAQARRNPLGRLPPNRRRQRRATTCPMPPGGYPVGDPVHTWEAPVGVSLRRRKAVGLDRVRDPAPILAGTPRGPVPLGGALSAEPATGLGGKRCPLIHEAAGPTGLT